MILTWFAICLERAPESQHQLCLECNCLNFYHSDTSSCSEYDKHWIMHGHCTVFVIVKTSTHILCLKWTNLKWVNETFRKFRLESKWNTTFRVVPVEIFPATARPPFPRSRAHNFKRAFHLTRYAYYMRAWNRLNKCSPLISVRMFQAFKLEYNELNFRQSSLDIITVKFRK